MNKSMAIKMAGFALKSRVGQVSGKHRYFFLGLNILKFEQCGFTIG